MENELFVLMLGGCFAAVLAWAFRTLPQEQWQIVATLPRKKEQSGRWVGVNLTYYGLITASAASVAIVSFLILMAAIRVPLGAALAAVGVVLLCCLPASRLLARVIERKPHTSTVAGAVFVGLLIAPLVVAAINRCAVREAIKTPMGPTVAAMTVAYLFGEGLGRLACISFGCCYGKPITQVGPATRRLFERFHFAFAGETKKIAYESGLQGIKVVPIQALTASLYVAVGLIGLLLFLDSWFRAAYAVTIVCSQGWRVYSETLRADHRGGGRISTYQKMTLVGMAYALVILILLPPATGIQAHLALGLAALWNPAVIIVLQALWTLLFLQTGWSMVTGSVLSFHVHHDRI